MVIMGLIMQLLIIYITVVEWLFTMQSFRNGYPGVFAPKGYKVHFYVNYAVILVLSLLAWLSTTGNTDFRDTLTLNYQVALIYICYKVFLPKEKE